MNEEFELEDFEKHLLRKKIAEEMHKVNHKQFMVDPFPNIAGREDNGGYDVENYWKKDAEDKT